MSILTCAIQIGTSRILAVAAMKNNYNGTVSNIQIESEPARDCVSHGCITNIERAAMHIRSLIQKLGNRMGASISAAYVGIGGMSLHSLVQQPSVSLPGYDVLSADPIGNSEYQLIVGESRIRQNVKAAMVRAGVRLVDFVALPKATAYLLTEEERQKGCLLLDMGAATTTVSIYKDGDLKHLAVIPLAGDSVTYDIQSTGCSFDDAERYKHEWSDVSQEVPSESNSAASRLFSDQALPIPQGELNKIALCRYEEIAANVLHQIELSQLQGKLEAGCILTGGVAPQRGLTALMSRRLGIARIEVRAYREPGMIGSDRKPHLTNLLALLNFCCEECKVSVTPVKEESRVAATPAPERPVTSPAASDGQQTLDMPDEPEEKQVQEPKPADGGDYNPEDNKIFEMLKKFGKDLFTGQK